MNSKLINLTTLGSVLSLVLTFSIVARAQSPEIRRSYDFRQGALSWQADFVGYTQFNQNIYEMLAEIRTLPPELGVSGTGFYVQAHNRCDCLVMFLKRRLDASDGVVAGQRYRVSYTVTLASNAQDGCIGPGSPGESVKLMFGGAQIEPVTFTGLYDTRRLNVESAVASIAGDIANGTPCNPSSRPYISIQRTHQHTSEITANPAGELWMFVGTRSGFEGFTALYYQRIDVVLTPVSTPEPNPVNPPTLITEENTGNVLALNALTFVRDPFPFYTNSSLTFDGRTYVMLFARNSALAPGESNSAITVLAEDERGIVFQLPVESVAQVPNLDWLTQIVVRLPNELQGGKNVRVSFNLRGATSSKAGIKFSQ